ncbi:MAG: heavy metal translocating P-type ATPase, partial [Sciscionella sp.]
MSVPTRSRPPQGRQDPATPPQRVELSLAGMTCAACAVRVERKLNKLDGVSATVNYATERASVSAEPSVTADVLVSAVEKAGYRAALITEDGEDLAQHGDPVRALWRRLVVALVLFVPLCDLPIVFSIVPDLRFPSWQWVLTAMALPVVGWAAWPFHAAAARNLRHGSVSMDTLVSMGIIAATVASLWAMFFTALPVHTGGVLGLILKPSGAIYLEVAAGVTTFLLAGRYFEARAKRSAGSTLRALAKVGAKRVTLLAEDDSEFSAEASMVRVGDRFVVRPGEIIATDGVVLSGRSEVDTSTMTGESVPREVDVDGEVIGGTVVVDGRLVVRATEVGEATQLASMVRLVERAQTEKADIQRLADRVSGVFVPIVLGIAALTLLAWLLLATPNRAFAVALSVLIIACPCALGLATPTA